MSGNRSVDVVIGATLSGSFKSAIGQAKKGLDDVGSAIKSLDGKSALNGMGKGAANIAKVGEAAQRASAGLRAAEKELDAYTRASQRAERAAGRHAKSESLRNRVMERGRGADGVVGGVIGAGITGNVLARMIKPAIEFETKQVNIDKVMDFGTGDPAKEAQKLGELGKSLQQLGTELPTTVSGLQDIAAAGARMGVESDKILDFTKTVAKLSTAWEMDPDKAGDSLGKLKNVMGLTMGQVDQLGDAINKLDDTTTAKAPEILGATGRMGSAGRCFGLTPQQVAAMATAMIDQGADAHTSATAGNELINTLSNLANGDVKKPQVEAMKKLGLTSKQLKGAIKADPQKALMAVIERIGKLNSFDQTSVLTGLFGTGQTTETMAKLVTGLDVYKKSLETIAKQSNYLGSSQAELDKRIKSTAGQLAIFKNNLVTVATNVGTTLLPALNQTMKGLTPVIQKMGTWAEQNPETVKFGLEAVGGLIAARIAMALGSGLTTVLAGAMTAALSPFAPILATAIVGALLLSKSDPSKGIVHGGVPDNIPNTESIGALPGYDGGGEGGETRRTPSMPRIGLSDGLGALQEADRLLRPGEIDAAEKSIREYQQALQAAKADAESLKSVGVPGLDAPALKTIADITAKIEEAQNRLTELRKTPTLPKLGETMKPPEAAPDRSAELADLRTQLAAKEAALAAATARAQTMQRSGLPSGAFEAQKAGLAGQVDQIKAKIDEINNATVAPKADGSTMQPVIEKMGEVQQKGAELSGTIISVPVTAPGAGTVIQQLQQIIGLAAQAGSAAGSISAPHGGGGAAPAGGAAKPHASAAPAGGGRQQVAAAIRTQVAASTRTATHNDNRRINVPVTVASNNPEAAGRAVGAHVQRVAMADTGLGERGSYYD